MKGVIGKILFALLFVAILVMGVQLFQHALEYKEVKQNSVQDNVADYTNEDEDDYKNKSQEECECWDEYAQECLPSFSCR